MANMTTWRKELQRALEDNNETFEGIRSFHWAKPNKIKKLSESAEELDREFNKGFGRLEGFPFIAWTDRNVYFCVGYDGSEGVDSVPRNPSAPKYPGHIGG